MRWYCSVVRITASLWVASGGHLALTVRSVSCSDRGGVHPRQRRWDGLRCEVWRGVGFGCRGRGLVVCPCGRMIRPCLGGCRRGACAGLGLAHVGCFALSALFVSSMVTSMTVRAHGGEERGCGLEYAGGSRVTLLRPLRGREREQRQFAHVIIDRVCRCRLSAWLLATLQLGSVMLCDRLPRGHARVDFGRQYSCDSRSRFTDHACCVKAQRSIMF